MVRGMELVEKFAMDRCGVPLKMGVSINTGEAMVGNAGIEKEISDMEYLMHQEKLKEKGQPAKNPGAAPSSDKQTDSA